MQDTKYILYTVISGLLYGTIGYFGMTLLKNGFSITNMLFWRFALAGLMLLAFNIYKKNFKIPTDKKIIKGLVLSIITYAIATWFYFYSSTKIGSGLAMVLFYAYPAIVALLMFIHKRDKLTKFEMTSIIVIIIGCILMAEEFNLRSSLGIIAGLISAFLYALYMCFSKYYSERMDSKMSSCIVCLGIAGFYLISFLFNDHIFIPKKIDIWFTTICFAFIGTLLPMYFLYKGMEKISATKASIISVLEPVSTLAIGVAVLHEKVTFLQITGSYLILSGALIVFFPHKK